VRGMGDRLPELKAQVGGHKRFKVYSNEYVCKPLDRREARFYLTCSSALENFIPHFKGTVNLDSSSSQDDFIILENLCTGYRKPCVLDLKMGTRMYGDFATEKKRRSQELKTKQTTSGKLGVRLCGYQRYSKSSSCFQKVDKYVGRKVDVQKFQEMLEVFFTVGGVLQRRVIRSLLKQAERLGRVVLSLDSYRFYSSSLLVIFEGDPPDNFEDEDEEDFDDDSNRDDLAKPDNKEGDESRQQQRNKAPILRLIDFANVTFKGFSKDDILHEGPDSGFLFGLNNLVNILNTIHNNHPQCNCHSQP